VWELGKIADTEGEKAKSSYITELSITFHVGVIDFSEKFDLEGCDI